MVRLSELEDWLREAPAGEKRIYYRGYLAVDQFALGKDGRLKEDQPIEPIASIARTMRQAAEAGRVFLFQRRLGPWEFEYIAVTR